jgi:hypothetical protein
MHFSVLETQKIRCPSCDSHRIHQSRRKGLLEKWLLAMIFVRPFRCERCDLRFFTWSVKRIPDALHRVRNGELVPPGV